MCKKIYRDMFDHALGIYGVLPKYTLLEATSGLEQGRLNFSLYIF